MERRKHRRQREIVPGQRQPQRERYAFYTSGVNFTFEIPNRSNFFGVLNLLNFRRNAKFVKSGDGHFFDIFAGVDISTPLEGIWKSLKIYVCPKKATRTIRAHATSNNNNSPPSAANRVGAGLSKNLVLNKTRLRFRCRQNVLE